MIKFAIALHAWIALCVGFAYAFSVIVGPLIAHLPEPVRIAIAAEAALAFLLTVIGGVWLWTRREFWR